MNYSISFHGQHCNFPILIRRIVRRKMWRTDKFSGFCAGRLRSRFDLREDDPLRRVVFKCVTRDAILFNTVIVVKKEPPRERTRHTWHKLSNLSAVLREEVRHPASTRQDRCFYRFATTCKTNFFGRGNFFALKKPDFPPQKSSQKVAKAIKKYLQSDYELWTSL